MTESIRRLRRPFISPSLTVGTISLYRFAAFTSVRTVCPYPSQVKQDFSHEDPDIETVFKLRFNLSRYIQVAATPDDSELKYTGPLFQRLATIQIVGSGTAHTLCAEQKASWKWLEDTLHHAASTFTIDSFLPMEFAMLPLPSSYSYLRVHKKHAHALRPSCGSHIRAPNLVIARFIPERHMSRVTVEKTPTHGPASDDISFVFGFGRRI
ncbi:hypothetical protein EDD22DRAFT_851664 [Suillus occidentalis]|nr:hypothetical protein EDD22DRAFT_851664 [Suillus occidentalis]